MFMHLAAPTQCLGISQYSEQQRSPDKLLFGTNLRQNNVLVVLNAVYNRDSHSEQLPTPAWATGGHTLFVFGRCQWESFGVWKVLW